MSKKETAKEAKASQNINSNILELKNHSIATDAIIGASKTAKNGDGESGICVHLVSGNSIIEFFELGTTGTEEDRQGESENQRDLFISKIADLISNK